MGLLVLGVLWGVALGGSGSRRFAAEGTDRAREAAFRGAQWLQALLVRAQGEGRALSLRISQGARRPYLEACWTDTGIWERHYTDEVCWFLGEGGGTWILYNPKWHTLSPGFTLRAYATSEGGPRSVASLVVSPLCRVSLVPSGF